MSARSTTFLVSSEMYCCRTREPSFASRLKRMLAELSVAEYSRTGIDTRPKLRDSDAIERAAIENLVHRRGLAARIHFAPKAGSARVLCDDWG